MKKLLVLLMLLTAKMAAADMPSTHGMLLFGDKQTYASHLPMFHAPHDYQLIMEIEVGGFPRSMASEFYKDVKKSGGKLFTLVPEKMDLTEVINGTKTKFSANVYAGHFEKGGNDLGPVYVYVKKIIFSKKLNPSESSILHVGEFNKHVLFGADGEYYAAHVVAGKPSYDAVYSITKPSTYTFPSAACTSRACNSFTQPKFIQDSELPVFSSNHTTVLPAPAEIGTELGLWNNTATILEVIYTEVGELSH